MARSAEQLAERRRRHLKDLRDQLALVLQLLPEHNNHLAPVIKVADRLLDNDAARPIRHEFVDWLRRVLISAKERHMTQPRTTWAQRREEADSIHVHAKLIVTRQTQHYLNNIDYISRAKRPRISQYDLERVRWQLRMIKERNANV